jgi:hypothetical protein
VRDFRSGWTKVAFPPVLDKLDESNFTGSRTDCKDNVIILSTRILPMPIRISGDVCSISA